MALVLRSRCTTIFTHPRSVLTALQYHLRHMALSVINKITNYTENTANLQLHELQRLHNTQALALPTVRRKAEIGRAPHLRRKCTPGEQGPVLSRKLQRRI